MVSKTALLGVKVANIPTKKALSAMTEKQWDAFWFGNKKFEGLIPWLDRVYETTEREALVKQLDTLRVSSTCQSCFGTGLNETARSVLIGGVSITDVSAKNVSDAYDYFSKLKLKGRDGLLGDRLKDEILSRLRFLLEVGLGYLHLDRRADTLAGGEAQRIRLAAQLGSKLTGACYVLDEPTIGLHPRDNRRLLGTLKGLRDHGNSVIVVEHDEDTILEADHIIDLGPGGGRTGGTLVYDGPPAQLHTAKESRTAQWMTQRRVLAERRKERGAQSLTVHKASANNLKDITVAFPMQALVCNGSIRLKSTLVRDVLYRGLKRKFDGSALGRCPRSHSRFGPT